MYTEQSDALFEEIAALAKAGYTMLWTFDPKMAAYDIALFRGYGRDIHKIERQISLAQLEEYRPESFRLIIVTLERMRYELDKEF